jgi:sulfite exporter TauE/SafE
VNAEFAVITVLLAGFFGSSHCLGMCGAIVVLFEAPDANAGGASAWLRRLSYNLGRGSFYVLLGATAGLSGGIVTQAAGVAPVLMALRLVAAALVIAIGLNLIFDWQLTRFVESAGAGLWRRMSRLARHVLPANTIPRAIAAGFIWGSLPCGLVYSAVAIAATSGTALTGATIMLAFWLGTLPTLLFAGASAKYLQQLRSAKLMRRVAGILVILIGLAALLPFATKSSGHDQHAASFSQFHAQRQLLC